MVINRHIYKITKTRVGRPSHPTGSEGLYLQVLCMHLDGILWQPQPMRGWTHRGAAANGGIQVGPQVIESEGFLLVHDSPPLSQMALLPPCFSLFSVFALFSPITAGQRFGVCFFLSTSLLVFIPLRLITPWLTIFLLCLLIVFFL